MTALESGPLEADYLVVGAGAMGMAFADEILHTSKTARVVVVDRRAKPGGHWNSAYRFVTLHQPALYYGVNSEPLGEDERDLMALLRASFGGGVRQVKPKASRGESREIYVVGREYLPEAAAEALRNG